MTEEVEKRKNRLTDEELTILKEMIASEKNMRWLWSSLRNASLGIVTVITAIVLSYDSFVSMLKNMVSK